MTAPEIKPPVELVVASGKGGVGKSTLTAVLALTLAEKGYHMVAVDADAEAPNLHLVLGVTQWEKVDDVYEGRLAYILEDKCTRCNLCAEECAYGAVEIKDGKYVINPYICEGCLTCSLVCPPKAIRYKFRVKSGEIRVAKTGYGFTLVSSETMPGRPNSGKIVTEAKNKGKELLGPSGVLLVDAAAGIGCQVISSLTGAQLSILVAEPTLASLSDLKRIHKLTKHFGIAPMLVINKYDINQDVLPLIEEYAEKENIPIIGKIPYDPEVPKALATNKPITIYSPDSPAAKAAKKIAEYVADEVLPQWRTWWAKYRPKKPEPYVPVVLRPGQITSTRER
ncbi:ATP-binding protein [Pyrofollis japonicus]|uniref:ATP-binding protein n=1 Tax=Pyrofollis japonicus TaxID=3060460 RepID=UPI00295BA4DE|nr:ATP-binding protein [Pyrofollis japonicus]BEP16682.1 ATP-binding protein [Pyrofollis japonicus]